MDNLQSGIAAFKSGDREGARKYFIAAIKDNPNDEHVWEWMYQITNNDKERFDCLNHILKINPQNVKAKEALEKLTAPPLQASQPAPKKKNNKILNYSIAIMVSLCFICLVMTWVVNLDTSPQNPQPTSINIPTEIPSYYVPVAPAYSIVEYKIIGSGKSASITYENSTGGTEQQDITIPWKLPKFKATSGQFLYISGQLNDKGTITCQIFLNGRLFKTATSSGQYVIVSCSDLVP